MTIDSIPKRLMEQARRRPSKSAYYRKVGESWTPTTWRTYASAVERAGRALIALGLQPGETVCILGFNRPEWVIMDVAAMGAGGVPAGIYTTSSPAEVRYILEHSEARVVVCETEAQWKKVEQERANLPDLKHVVMMEGAPEIADDMVMSWSEFLAQGGTVDQARYLERVDALEPDALATLIYTSGTTGPPKGVMLSHRNLSWTANVIANVFDMGPNDTSLSYLPLSHIAEQGFTILIPITTGGTVYFSESPDLVADNLREVQPSFFFGVPRIWEKFAAAIDARLSEATGARAHLIKWATKVGRDANTAPNGPKGFAHAAADKLLFSKLKPAIGLGNARVCVTGAAPIGKDVLEFFTGLDLRVLEVYGQSEGTGPTTSNLLDRYRFGTVGPALAGVTVETAEDGEILLKGPNVFLGYYKDPEATAEVLVDGWLHSGDLGAFDRDGFLSITGRKKDIIITAGGKNITPKNLEAAIKNHPLIDEAVVIGDRRKYLTALVTIDAEAGPAWAAQHGVAPDLLYQDARLRESIQAHVDELNRNFARVEQIKKFAVLQRNFSIEDGELTPTLKVKRAKVHAAFATEIEALYEGDGVRPSSVRA